MKEKKEKSRSEQLQENVDKMAKLLSDMSLPAIMVMPYDLEQTFTFVSGGEHLVRMLCGSTEETPAIKSVIVHCALEMLVNDEQLYKNFVQAIQEIKEEREKNEQVAEVEELPN